MVTNKQLIIGLLLVTICFAAIQIYLANRAPHVDLENDVKQRKKTIYSRIKDFVRICEDSHIHCILVDQTVLKALADNTFDGEEKCRYFCQHRIYTFAIRDSDYVTLKMDALRTMKRFGCNVRVTVSERIQSDIPTHIDLLCHGHPAIHIVMLHRRKTWWWYGLHFEKDSNLDFTRNEGVLDEFNYHYMTLDHIRVLVPRIPANFVQLYDSSKFLPCNQTRAQHFHKQHQRDNSEKANEFREVAINAIRMIKTHLDASGTPFWLSSGTLLGWFRQCDIIPYSVDVDIGVFIKDHSYDLLEKLQASSLRLEHKFGKVEDSLQYAFLMEKVKLDIFFFYEDVIIGKMWNGGTDYNTGEKFKYWFSKFTLCWTEFHDMKLRVPCDTETYIKANYGDNWFTPVKNWDWSKSPPNVVLNGEWEDDELDVAIQLWDRNGKRIPLEWTRDDD